MNHKIKCTEDLDQLLGAGEMPGAIGQLSEDNLAFFRGQLKFVNGKPAGYWLDVMIAGDFSEAQLADYVAEHFDITAEQFLAKYHWFGLPCVRRPYFNCPD